jgi:hypothetical protein
MCDCTSAESLMFLQQTVFLTAGYTVDNILAVQYLGLAALQRGLVRRILGLVLD